MVRKLRRLWKTAEALLAHTVWGFPGRKLRVIGVTGTDGKTTTVHLTVTALESAGYTVGAVSTIHFQVGTRRWTNTSKLTTPGPWQLARLLAHMVRAGCHYAVLECSSHRLDQGGLTGIPVDVAAITNITREHFDYHRDFAGYAAAKRRLFWALNHPAKLLPRRLNVDRGGRVPTVAVVNLDDERCRAMLEEPAEEKYGFTLQAEGIRQQAAETSVTLVTARPVGQEDSRLTTHDSRLFCVRAGDREALLSLRLPGTFNVQNALAAIAVGVSQDIPLARITRELSEVEGIPGRLERVDHGQPFTVLIDYAVTPAAFEALYAEMSKLQIPSSKQAQNSKIQIPHSRPRIIHVFGAAGGRDRGKRPLLGEIAGQHADLVILTDEDPFNEDPEQILDDIEMGLKAVGTRQQEVGAASHARDSRLSTLDSRGYLRIRDRRLAIREALRRARSGDLVLITGKGAEETMAVGDQRIPWSDRRVVEEELRRLGGG